MQIFRSRFWRCREAHQTTMQTVSCSLLNTYQTCFLHGSFLVCVWASVQSRIFLVSLKSAAMLCYFWCGKALFLHLQSITHAQRWTDKWPKLRQGSGDEFLTGNDSVINTFIILVCNNHNKSIRGCYYYNARKRHTKQTKLYKRRSLQLSRLVQIFFRTKSHHVFHSS